MDFFLHLHSSADTELDEDDPMTSAHSLGIPHNCFPRHWWRWSSVIVILQWLYIERWWFDQGRCQSHVNIIHGRCMEAGGGNARVNQIVNQRICPYCMANNRENSRGQTNAIICKSHGWRRFYWHTAAWVVVVVGTWNGKWGCGQAGRQSCTSTVRVWLRKAFCKSNKIQHGHTQLNVSIDLIPRTCVRGSQWNHTNLDNSLP